MRKILEIYRLIQYLIFGRKRFGIMQPGINVNVELYRYEENKGDIVHPCVRYIPGGFEGHSWWMVYTPYYRSDASLEQPVLCYAESDDAETPPTNWRTHCLVNDKIPGGYNSDPNLLYHNGTLYVYWRENYETPNKGHYRATFVAKVTADGVERVTESPVVWTDDSEMDPETSPTFMPAFGSRDGFVCYGVHLQFHSKKVKGLNKTMRRFVERILLVSDMLGVYSQQKHLGIAIWKGNSPAEPYTLEKTIKLSNCNSLYRLWHMDFFDHDGKRYAIVQTNMSNADLCLAESLDGVHFTLFKKPLITNATIGKVGIYKPCAGVTPNGKIYLYYSAQDIDNRSLNKLYVTDMMFDELIEKIR